MRTITHRYDDPLDRVWLDAARRIGLNVVRTPDVFASTDGRGTLQLGTPDTLDADDCLAQMILHELCHSLIAGPDSFGRTDFGLDNESDSDLEHEQACLRLQAFVSRRYGLRSVLAPTTEHRTFYDSLGVDPLEGRGRGAELARRATARLARPPWAPHLARALRATQKIVDAVAITAPANSLFARRRPSPSPHPTGVRLHPRTEIPIEEPDPREPTSVAPAASGCGTCAWAGPDSRCVVLSRSIRSEWPACEYFEEEVACEGCGACCREAFDVVEMDSGDSFASRHPQLVRREGERIVLARVQGRCPVLRGTGVPGEPYRCAHYEDRPRTCRELERGGPNCLHARARVGLSREYCKWSPDDGTSAG